MKAKLSTNQVEQRRLDLLAAHCVRAYVRMRANAMSASTSCAYAQTHRALTHTHERVLEWRRLCRRCRHRRCALLCSV